VLDDEVEHQSHAGMGERAAGVRFDRYARKGEGPWIAELALDRRGIVTAARGLEEAAAGFENDGCRGENRVARTRRQRRRFRTHVRRGKAFIMVAEILAQARGLAGGDAQRAPVCSILNPSKLAQQPAPAAIAADVAVLWNRPDSGRGFIASESLVSTSTAI